MLFTFTYRHFSLCFGKAEIKGEIGVAYRISLSDSPFKYKISIFAPLNRKTPFRVLTGQQYWADIVVAFSDTSDTTL
jgi:hypothetical protein